MALRPNAGHGFLILEVSRSQAVTEQSSGRVISSSQRPLHDNTQQKNFHAHHRGKNLKIHQASSRRPTP